MASSPRTSEREEERRLNLRTLVIASVASASAAAVTSQLWIAGTWVAAAVTPVLVTLLSELLNRPTERIAQKLTTDSSAVPDPGAPHPGETTAPGPGPTRPPAVEPTPGPDIPRDPDAPQVGAPGPVRVYRQTSRPPTRRIAVGVVATTAAIAFVAGVVLFTTTELLAGESIGKSGNRTTLGIGGKKSSDADRQQPTDTGEETDTSEEQERQQTQPSTEEEQPPPDTETTPPPTETEAPTPRTAPSETTPAQPPAQTAPAP
jgi:hypothetical protein